MRRFELAHDGAEIEAQLGVELARELLHAAVVGEARHVEELEPAVARGQQRARQQRGADAVALPGMFDAERRLGFAVETGAERPQFTGAAQHAVDEEAMDDAIEAVGYGDVVADKFVRHAGAETAAAGAGIEPQQMLAIDVGLAGPQLSDPAALGKDVAHSGTPGLIGASGSLPHRLADSL